MKSTGSYKLNEKAKKYTGKVVSNANDKTVVVEVAVIKKHKLYGKNLRRSKRYQVHAEQDIEIGTKVEIAETRKISKNKYFIVTKVLK